MYVGDLSSFLHVHPHVANISEYGVSPTDMIIQPHNPIPANVLPNDSEAIFDTRD